MGHGIETARDFVHAAKGRWNGGDWHKLTEEKEGELIFPGVRIEGVTSERGVKLPWRVMIAEDDGLPMGKPFSPDTFVPLLPNKGLDMVHKALAGTAYCVERVGMLWDRSFWFVSVGLDELKGIGGDKGNRYFLNFSGGLDGSAKPQAELCEWRGVCWNTISASRALADYLFNFKQTKNSIVKYDAAQKEIERAAGMARVFEATLATMASKGATLEVARAAYAGEVVRAGGRLVSDSLCKDGTRRESKALNLVDALTGLFVRGDGNKGETRADVLNGFTQYFTRGGLEGSAKNPWKAVASSEFGGNGERKAEFARVCADDKEFNGLVREGRLALKEAGSPALEIATN